VHEFSVDPSATILIVRTVRFAAFAVLAGLGPAAAREALPWVDDYSRAVAQARAKNVPIFVEAWAPW
jgi:hypothetical protein